MRRLAVVALLVALVSLVVSGWALQRTYDKEEETSATTTTQPGVTTTIPLVVVPTVIGKDGRAAAFILASSALGFTTVRAPSVTVAEDHIIAQNPQQGIEVPEGTVIKLTLSSGSP